MDVQEAVLYSEIRKIQNKQSEDHTRKELQEIQIKTLTPAPPVTERKITNPFETEEREIIRILLKYFHQEAFEFEDEETHQVSKYSVGFFVLNELHRDELISVNPRVRNILAEMEKNLDKKDFDPIRFFTHHPDNEISQYASNLLSEKYIQSKRWSRGGAFVESESDLLYLLVPKLVQEYKLKNVKALLKNLESQISEASQNDQAEQMLELMNQYQNLKKIVKELSERLGNRTIS
jgi:DNA primase